MEGRTILKETRFIHRLTLLTRVRSRPGHLPYMILEI
ncbi:unnamed protein product [Nezara viridula]|uniref:Uncharacterized protein n=1 Tax=Nezara viridula TaxID=85310 RepID=A0A9P0H5Z3_NEZVI|nr:unnamed protein product [Nezara viridula]